MFQTFGQLALHHLKAHGLYDTWFHKVETTKIEQHLRFARQHHIVAALVLQEKRISGGGRLHTGQFLYLTGQCESGVRLLRHLYIGHVLVRIAQVAVEHIVVLAVDSAEETKQHGAQHELESEQRQFPDTFVLRKQAVSIDHRYARIDIAGQQAATDEHDETDGSQHKTGLGREERSDADAYQIAEPVLTGHKRQAHDKQRKHQKGSGLFHRGQVELVPGCSQYLADGHQTGPSHHRADNDEDIVHHCREEHHKSHYREDDAGGADRLVLHTAPAHRVELEPVILNARSMEVIPRNQFLQHLVHLLLHHIQVCTGAQPDVGSIAVVAHQLTGAVEGIQADAGERHNDVELIECGVLFVVVEHAGHCHGMVGIGQITERFSHHVASQPLIEPSADEALSLCSKDGLRIALLDVCGKDVEKAGVGQYGGAKSPTAAVLEQEFVVFKLVGPSCAHFYLGYVAAQRRDGTAWGL